MGKVDLKTEIASYRAPRGAFAVVDVAPADYLMVDGHGDPNTAESYADALASLYPVAYRLKFLTRAETGIDHVVMPLEALWWSADLASFTTARDKSRWSWTLMIMVPGGMTHDQIARAKADVAAKGRGPVLDQVRFDRLDEGLSVQTLHVGAYDDEGPVLAALHDTFLPENDLAPTDKHHEIYLDDARRTPAHRLRTILRQPVRRTAGLG